MSKLADRVEYLEEMISMMEPALRNAQASQGVHEFFIIHLLTHLCAMTDDPQASIANIVKGIEISMKLQAEAMIAQYGDGAKKSMDVTMAYLDSLKRKVMATGEFPAMGKAN